MLTLHSFPYMYRFSITIEKHFPVIMSVSRLAIHLRIESNQFQGFIREDE